MAHPVVDASPLRILLVKTSSLGDVLHNLPVVSDIASHYPDARIDWLVEESFAALPLLHPAVNNVIRVAVRRWRKSLFNRATLREIAAARSALSAQRYDIAIDTQGLLKSALLMRGADGLRCGFDRHCAREPLAAAFYQRTFYVPAALHAVERNRRLAASSLGYTLDAPANFGIRPPSTTRPAWLHEGSYAILLHATSRSDKLWDEANWIGLGKYFHQQRIPCVLPWGNEAERLRSLRLASAIPQAICPPRLALDEAAALLGGACAVVGVDTGLAHLSAALGAPTVGIYTATDPGLTGLYPGPHTANLGNIDAAPDISAVINALHQVLP